MAGGVIGKAGKEVWFHPGDGRVEEGSGGELLYMEEEKKAFRLKKEKNLR